MSKKLKSVLTRYGISTAVGALLVALTLSNFDFEGASTKDIVCCWCDAFSVSGILLLMAGLFIWVSNQGAFHGLSYAMTVAGKALMPGGRLKMETYPEYVERKQGKQIKGYGCVFIVGGVFFAIGLILTLVFNLM